MSRIKYVFLSVGLLFLIAVIVTAAMYVPQMADKWQDMHTLGITKYADMSYEPYEITYYSSFGEKLEAVMSSMKEDGDLYEMKLREQTRVTDDELIRHVNEELGGLYEKKILREALTATEIFKRDYYELYPSMEGQLGRFSQPVYYWILHISGVNDTTFRLCMDSEYYKIYAFSYSSYERTFSEENWGEEIYNKGPGELSQNWIDYWEIPGAKSYMTVEVRDVAENEQLAGVDDTAYYRDGVYGAGGMMDDWDGADGTTDVRGGIYDAGGRTMARVYDGIIQMEGGQLSAAYMMLTPGGTRVGMNMEAIDEGDSFYMRDGISYFLIHL